MPVGLIPALIAAGGAVGSAAIAAHAAGEATDAQTTAANNALNVQQSQYNQTRSDYAPYRNLGVSALPQLSAFASAPVVSRGGPTGYQPGYQPASSPMPAPGLNLNALSSFAGGPGTVMLQAPNGQRKAVPRKQVDHFLALGAKVI